MFWSFESQVIEMFTPLISFSPHKVRKLRTIWLIKTYLLWHGRKNNCWWKLLLPPAPVSRLATSESCWASRAERSRGLGSKKSVVDWSLPGRHYRYWHSCDHTTLQGWREWSELHNKPGTVREGLPLCCGERALLLWAQEWDVWRVLSPAARPSQSVLARKHWFCKFWAWAADQWVSHPDPRKHNQCENNPGMRQIKQGLAISRDLCCDLDNFCEKSTKKRAVAKKVVDVRVWKWVTVRDGKKLSCYFSIISMQRGWWWSYWWWQETGVGQISEMGLGWFKITRNVWSCLWCGGHLWVISPLSRINETFINSSRGSRPKLNFDTNYSLA